MCVCGVCYVVCVVVVWCVAHGVVVCVRVPTIVFAHHLGQTRARGAKRGLHQEASGRGLGWHGP